MQRILRQDRWLRELLLQVVGDVGGVGDESPVVLEAGELPDRIDPSDPQGAGQGHLLDSIVELLPVENASDLVAKGGDLELVQGDRGSRV
jgi:hypothetical protein